jgi:hypothetical protein
MIWLVLPLLLLCGFVVGWTLAGLQDRRAAVHSDLRTALKMLDDWKKP